MSGAALLAFILAAGLLAMTPGVDTALVLRALVLQGRRAAAAAVAGVALGCLGWGVAAALGLGVVLHKAPALHDSLKVLGGLYLLWLGLRSWCAPRQTLAMPKTPQASAAQAFSRGGLTNVLNPKVGVFYLSFLPQFVPAEGHATLWALGLAALHVLLSLLWFALLIALGASVQRQLQRPAVLRAMDRLTGLVFIAFGLRLMLSRP